jgi:lipopolysaccharide biosynthesis glycosyltransferase
MINVAFSANDKCSKVLSVTIASILVNHKISSPEDKIHFFFIGCDFSDKSKEKLLSLKKYQDFEYSFIDVDTSILYNLPTKLTNISLHAYYKLLITEILPQGIDKIIYLDSFDIIFSNDIQKLWDINIDNYLMSAVLDLTYQLFEKVPDAPLLYRKENYINSGVVVFNINNLREFKFYDKMKNFISDKNNVSKLRIAEQDILNEIVTERVLILPDIYNMIFSLCIKYLEQKKDVNDIVVIHYAGAKPWHPTCPHPLRDIYFKYALLSPWDLTSKLTRIKDYIDFAISFLKRHPLFFLDKKYPRMIKNIIKFKKLR